MKLHMTEAIVPNKLSYYLTTIKKRIKKMKNLKRLVIRFDLFQNLYYSGPTLIRLHSFLSLIKTLNLNKKTETLVLVNMDEING